MSKLFLFTAIILLFANCAPVAKIPPSTKAFYYWKTQYKLSDLEIQTIKETEASKIYFRAFDINYKFSGDWLEPNQVMLWQQEPLKNVEYIPTVFIDYKLFLAKKEEDISNTEISADSNLQAAANYANMINGTGLTALQIDGLAVKIIGLCKQILAYKDLPLKEIQIDCDWTEKSKANYFGLLRCIKARGCNVSSTLRLWQYKMRETAGIPPADYVTLMCYNMGELGAAQNSNSILQQDVLEKYLQNAQPYPLPVSIALPIFTWYLKFENNKFDGIFYKLPSDSSSWKKDSNKIVITKPHYDEASQTYYSNEMYFKEEKVSVEELLKAQTFINSIKINTKNETIYFSLDSANVRHAGNALTN
jgi:hypothetical protein